jgi:hypothetical protein
MLKAAADAISDGRHRIPRETAKSRPVKVTEAAPKSNPVSVEANFHLIDRGPGPHAGDWHRESGAPGWESHKIVSRIDGWVIDPDDEARIPSAIAEMIARAMPPLGDDTVADIRSRMYARHRKVLGHD